MCIVLSGVLGGAPASKSLSALIAHRATEILRGSYFLLASPRKLACCHEGVLLLCTCKPCQPSNVCSSACPPPPACCGSILPPQAVKKTVKGKAYIDDDEHDKNKLLLGLGCVLVAIGAPIIGVFGKKVDDGESYVLCQGLLVCFRLIFERGSQVQSQAMSPAHGRNEGSGAVSWGPSVHDPSSGSAAKRVTTVSDTRTLVVSLCQGKGGGREGLRMLCGGGPFVEGSVEGGHQCTYHRGVQPEG